MKRALNVHVLLFLALPLAAQADCLSGEDVAQNSDVTLYEQVSYINKQTSAWQIEGKNPYTRHNGYQEAGVGIRTGCSIIDNKLDLKLNLYGINEYALKPAGKFESDDSRTRALINRLSLVYSASDSVQFEAGKLGASSGMFFLRSPSDLQTHYYTGFQSTRLHDPKMASVYQSSSWAGKMSVETRDYAFTASVVPKLATIDKRYITSGNWSASQQGNSDEAYLLSYSDHRFGEHTPSVTLRLGPSPSVALSDSYHYSPQLTLNIDAAYHRTQQWRHLSRHKVAQVEQYQFPNSLYETADENNVELALGAQYTRDNFSVFGVEYYFQSEGYSRAEQRQQRDFIDFLNTRTGYAPLDQAFDSYKYLMASEISNTANQGMLQGKHYLNTYASLPLAGGATLQPSMVVNVMDRSTLLNVHYSTPLSAINNQIEAYAGAWSALGHRDAEFALFGDTLGLYLGFKYYL
ncbi:hypothetical protein DBY68_009815 [Pseudocitrobacter sp. RIT415]|uniref:hypothetical protein n=1 Tax=Pseudocitrobacter sp. RIT415 TaxID=2202163 RepID=UPI000D33C0FD|nr:hypothetical protein [Pseudocitrobacter sp. RIT 415]RAU50201.1 hypothetical protein DBY68_009815 [Pseudocitrobacter sp. RIT 415]